MIDTLSLVHYQQALMNGDGVLLVGQLVHVRKDDGSTAMLYSPSGMAGMPNPTMTDWNGNLTITVDHPGVYRLRVNGSEIRVNLGIDSYVVPEHKSTPTSVRCRWCRNTTTERKCQTCGGVQ